MIRQGLIHDQLEYFSNEPKFEAEMNRAFREFFGQAPAMIECDRTLRQKLDRHEGLFSEWFFFHFVMKSGMTPIAHVIAENPAHVSQADLDLLRRIRDGRYGFYEIRKVQPAAGLLLYDIAHKKEVFVHEIRGSMDAVPGSTVLCRVADLGDRHEIVSGSASIFPATFGPRMQRRIRELMKKGECTPKEAFLLAENRSHVSADMHAISLPEAREMLAGAVVQAGIGQFVSVETIERWVRDELFGDNMVGPLNALLLLSGDSPGDMPDGAPDALAIAVSALSNVLPKKALDGKTPNEAWSERERKGEPPQMRFEEDSVLPINIGDYQRRGGATLTNGNPSEAIRIYDELLSEMLTRKIVFREPFRIIANQGVAYLFDGDREIGARMLEAAHALNPHYGFVSSQLERLQSGALDDAVEMGHLRSVERRFRTGELDRWSLDDVRNMKTVDLLHELAQRGISVTEKSFRTQAMRCTSAEDLADGQWNRSYTGTGEDEDILWTAALALWERWLPEDPAPDLLTTWFDDLEDSVDDMLESGMRRNALTRWREAFAHVEAAFAHPSPRMAGCWKVWHEKYVNEDSTDTVIYALARSLPFVPKIGDEYAKRIRALAERIRDTLTECGLDAVLVAYEMHTGNDWKQTYDTLLSFCETESEYGPLWVLGGYAEYIGDTGHAVRFYNDARTIAHRKLEQSDIPAEPKALHAQELILEHLDDLCNMIEEAAEGIREHVLLVADVRAVRRTYATKHDELRKLPIAQWREENFTDILKKLSAERYEAMPAARYLAWLSSLGIDYDFETIDKTAVWRMDGDRSARIGRNDSCYCGSGKKYKKCCLSTQGKSH